ncbi:MAG: hypothetical protein K0S70_1437 [Microbacterium sp.]|nr:hypothetical protein [Microbacterium sp.]
MRDGETHEVRHALRADGSCPSFQALTEMSEGRWSGDPDLANVPDDIQITQGQKLHAGIEFFAEYGYPNNRYCTVNNLNDGIWEFKLGAVRVSFFDTDGEGGHSPKYRIRHIDDADFSDEFWWLPGFDDYIRLGHCFGKNSQATDDHDLQEAVRVREEDLQYDRV